MGPRTQQWAGFARTALRCLCATTLLLAAGCGSSTPSTDKEAVTNAGGLRDEVNDGLVLSFTDGSATFATYTVEIVSATLIGSDGVRVQVFPLKTRADLSRYAYSSEFMSVSSAPPGTYTGMTLTIDYSTADIRVERADGAFLAAGAIHDADGNPLKKTTIPVMMGGRSIVVQRGRQAHVTLDFHLDASNAVDASGRFADVTVVPVVSADIEPRHPRPHDARGAIKNVDVPRRTVQVYLRPFYREVRRENNGFGSVTFVADDHTIYDINRHTETGPTGLKHLAALTRLTAIEVDSRIDPRTQQAVATAIRAGNSVPAVDLDTVEGTVTARDGSMLVLRGVTFERTNGHIDFHDVATVKLASNTPVREADDPYQHPQSDISIGQDITAQGGLSHRILHAEAGVVRMMPTALHGTVVSANPLTVNLDDLGGHPPAVFDFSHTAGDKGHDADPRHFVIDTDDLPLPSMSPGAPVLARGYAVPYGEAGGMDFSAEKHVRVDGQLTAVAALSWKQAPTGVLQAAADHLRVKLSGLAAFHKLVRGGVATDAHSLGDHLTVRPENGGGEFIVDGPGGRAEYGDFSKFSSALSQRLDAGDRLRYLAAVGSYDSKTHTEMAHSIKVQMQHVEVKPAKATPPHITTSEPRDGGSP